MSQVFISYSRNDAAAVLDIRKKLESAGVDIWIDQKDINTGAAWDIQIQDAISDSKVVLLMLSRSSVESENVSVEWSFALDKDKHIIPVILEECEVPMRIASLQRVELFEDFNLGIKKLKSEIEVDNNEYIKAVQEKERRKKIKPYIFLLKVITAIALFTLACWYAYREYYAPVVIEDVVGKTVNQAELILKKSNISVRYIKSQLTEGQEGTILSTEPPAGTQSTRFSTIDVYIVAEKTIVPNVTTLPYLEAEKKLEALGLSSHTEKVISFEHKAGEVVEQRPSPESKVKQGGKVDLKIAAKGGWAFIKQPEANVGDVIMSPKDLNLRRYNDSTSEANNIVGTMKTGTLIKIIESHGTGWKKVRVITKSEI